MFYNNINYESGHQMIELIFIFFVFEIIIFIWLVTKINGKIQTTKMINDYLTKTNLAGNFSSVRYQLKKLNKYYLSCLEEKKKEERNHLIARIFDILLLAFSIFGFFHKKHKNEK
jgi:hypothetical protein